VFGTDTYYSRPIRSVILDMRHVALNGTRILPTGGYYLLTQGQTYHFFIAIEQPTTSYHMLQQYFYNWCEMTGSMQLQYCHRIRASKDPVNQPPSNSFFKRRMVNEGGVNRCWQDNYVEVPDWERGLSVSYDPPAINFRVNREDIPNSVTVDATIGSLDLNVTVTRLNPFRLLGRVDNYWLETIR
jgi:hypothetical protein